MSGIYLVRQDFVPRFVALMKQPGQIRRVSHGVKMTFKVTDRITLPIGLDIDGARYREFVVDEMRGVDEENIATHKVGNNGAKAVSVMLQRSIQSIDGLLETKKNPFDFVPPKYIRNLYSPDRDYLFLAMQALSLETTFATKHPCPRCNETLEVIVDIEKLDVLEWDVPDPLTAEPEILIELPRGIVLPNGKKSGAIRWRFLNGIQQENISTLPKSKQTTGALAMGIVWVENLDGRPDTELIRRMTTRDRMHILEEIKEQTPGVDLRVPCVCENDKCNHEWSGEVDINNFFNSTAAKTTKTEETETSTAGETGPKKHKRALRRR